MTDFNCEISSHKRKIHAYVTEPTFFRSQYKIQHMAQVSFFLRQRNYSAAKILINQLLKDEQFCYATFTVSKAKKILEECSITLNLLELDFADYEDTLQQLSSFEPYIILQFPPVEVVTVFGFRLSNISVYYVNGVKMHVIEENTYGKKFQNLITGRKNCITFAKKIQFPFGKSVALEEKLNQARQRLHLKNNFFN